MRFPLFPLPLCSFLPAKQAITPARSRSPIVPSPGYGKQYPFSIQTRAKPLISASCLQLEFPFNSRPAGVKTVLYGGKGCKGHFNMVTCGKGGAFPRAR